MSLVELGILLVEPASDILLVELGTFKPKVLVTSGESVIKPIVR